MKKIILTLVIACSISIISAQTKKGNFSQGQSNQLSVEVAGGLNKPQKPMTSGYGASFTNSYTLDLGVRYMFNNKFGLKADFGYNNISGNNFDSKYYRIDGQGVANLGRIMNFESWSQNIGLLGHAGLGLSLLKKESNSIKDGMINIMAGVTGQIKLSDKIALTGNFTSIFNAKQNYAFDGMSPSKSGGFNGTLFNSSIGLTFYLGNNEKHIDWEVDNEIELLTQRITDLEIKIMDSDNDGVADYLDIEPNTLAGAKVDVKGKSIDLNNNNVPDDIEKFILKNYMNKADQTPILSDNELVKTLINSGSVAVYFDFDESISTKASIGGINFILAYLRKNPNDSIDIIGHTDGLGRPDYNKKLSDARANNIKKILEKANINPSRLTIVAAGVDSSLDKDSASTRELARRVTFQVK